MNGINVIALFCEDIREERDQVLSVIGILPDNINIEPSVSATPSQGVVVVDSAPRHLSKICVYVRINFDPDYEMPDIQMRLVFPDGVNIPVGAIGREVISKAKSQAKERGHPLAGVIGRLVMNKFDFSKSGVVKFEALIGEDTHIGGAITIRRRDSSVPSALPQPS